MKKILFIPLAIFVVTLNVFVVLAFNSRSAWNFITSDYNRVRIEFDDTKNISTPEWIEQLSTFSQNHNMNISQFRFIETNHLNIYSTNVQSDENIRLRAGEYPRSSEYISNASLTDTNVNQSGQIYFPISNLTVQIYDVEQIVNVGLDNTFLLSGDDDILQLFIEEFSAYGDAYQVIEHVSLLQIINMPLLMLSALLFVILVLGILFFLMFSRKKIMLERLWGYSPLDSLYSLFKELGKNCVILFLVILGGVVTAMLILGQEYHLGQYLLIFVLGNTILLSAMLAIMLIGVSYIIKVSSVSQNTKRKVFKKVPAILLILRVIVSTALFSLLAIAIRDLQVIRNQIDGASYWEQTQDVFRIQVAPLAEAMSEDRVVERNLNDKFVDFYNSLAEEHQGFIINAINFAVIDYDDRGQPIYQHYLNSQGMDAVLARNLEIDKHYLNVNPVYDINGKNVISQLVDDSYTMNVLVPERLRDFEEAIRTYWTEEFHFQAVTIYNMYNEAIGAPLRGNSIDDFKVNIIYIKSGSEFFTFDGMVGDNRSAVVDPIAAIIHDAFDPSVMGALTTSSLYFIDNSDGQAFTNIQPLLRKYGITVINNVVSVFGESETQLTYLYWRLFEQIMMLVIVAILSFAIFVLFIYMNFSIYSHKISIKYLLGYSYISSNAKLIVFSALSSLVASSLAFAVSGNLRMFLIMPVVVLLDWMVMYILSQYLTKVNVAKTLKGEHYD